MERVHHSTLKCSNMSLIFSVGKPEALDAVWQFLMANFFPDEPVTRSCFLPILKGPHTEEADVIKSMMVSEYVGKCLASNASVVVRNQQSDIIGVMLTAMHHRGSIEHSIDVDMSKLGKKSVWCFKFLESLEYKPNEQFRNYPESQIMAFGDILSVHQTARGQGLGTKMLLKSLELSKELGADHYFSALSSIYSQAIFTKANFQLVRTIVYDDFKDDEGNIVIDKQGEHKQCKTMVKKL